MTYRQLTRVAILRNLATIVAVEAQRAGNDDEKAALNTAAYHLELAAQKVQ